MLGRWIRALVDAQGGWADPFGGWVQRLLQAIFRRMKPVAGLLHGKWLGHSLHAALTDIPIGALVITIVLDLFDQRPAADLSLAVALLGMVAAMLTGLADYSETDLETTRRYGTVHSTLMLIAFVVLLVALSLRVNALVGDRALGIALTVAGFLVVVLAAHIGGDLVYLMGNMVDRHAWRSGGEKWTALEPQEIPEGTPTKGKAGAQTLLVVRRGEAVYALHDTCAHAGCSLSEGEVKDGEIECPCHGSRYRLADGRVTTGPATFDQPRYEVRREGGKIEVRRAGG